jgi:hypothetical protein
MPRGLCWILIVGLALAGCVKKDTSPPAQTSEVQPPPIQPVEANVPAPPAEPEHPVVVAAQAFVKSVAAGNYQRAMALSVPGGEITQQGLTGLHNAFQWDQATFTQVWLGAEQASVITNFIPARQGEATAAWAINLVATEDGHWLVRLTDMLANQQMIEDYVAAFREVAPNAKSLTP